MDKHLRNCLLAIVGIVLSWPASALAQSPLADARCRAGYWLLDAVCVNETTGDVVNAIPIATTAMAGEPGCAPGSWRIDEVCVSRRTGDVELANEERPPRRDADASR